MSEKILVFVPAYNCANQIGRVLAQLCADWVSQFIAKVIVIDNRSTDGTADAVRAHIAARADGFVSLLQNDENYGLGGSQKVAFDYARSHGFDWVVVLHGDDQGDIADLRPTLEDRTYQASDCLLGSRFMAGSRTPGYSAFRIFGNHVFNALYTLCLFQPVRDLGSGLNMYRVAALERTGYHRHPDNLTFNCVLLCAQAISQCRIVFFPISWREDDQVSNVKLVRQSIQTLRIALSALFGRGSFIAREHRDRPRAAYTWALIDG